MKLTYFWFTVKYIWILGVKVSLLVCYVLQRNYTPEKYRNDYLMLFDMLFSTAIYNENVISRKTPPGGKMNHNSEVLIQ